MFHSLKINIGQLWLITNPNCVTYYLPWSLIVVLNLRESHATLFTLETSSAHLCQKTLGSIGSSFWWQGPSQRHRYVKPIRAWLNYRKHSQKQCCGRKRFPFWLSGKCCECRSCWTENVSESGQKQMLAYATWAAIPRKCFLV